MNIINKDENGNWDGQQIRYYSNGNVNWIGNYHHGKPNGYQGYFKRYNSINYKSYCNMTKSIYEEDHWTNQINIKI